MEGEPRISHLGSQLLWHPNPEGPEISLDLEASENPYVFGCLQIPHSPFPPAQNESMKARQGKHSTRHAIFKKAQGTHKNTIFQGFVYLQGRDRVSLGVPDSAHPPLASVNTPE